MRPGNCPAEFYIWKAPSESAMKGDNMKTNLRTAMAVIVAILGLTLSLTAQETTAGMQGTVKDSSGAVVPSAAIEVTGSSLIGIRKLQTDSTGEYRITALPPGDYTLSVSAPGFQTFKQTGISLDVGRLPNID